MPAPNNVRRIAPLLEGALTCAGDSLSRLVSEVFSPLETDIATQSLAEFTTLLGKEDQPVVVILLEVHGDLYGFLAIIVAPQFAEYLTERLIGDNSSPDMAQSALGELGNIVGSAFLNYVADSFDCVAAPTPPQVVHDMAGALLSSLGVHVASTPDDDIPVIYTSFSNKEKAFTANLLWLPQESS